MKPHISNSCATAAASQFTVPPNYFEPHRASSLFKARMCWTLKNILRDMPSHREAYDQFYRSPCTMASVASRTWRFLYRQLEEP